MKKQLFDRFSSLMRMKKHLFGSPSRQPAKGLGDNLKSTTYVGQPQFALFFTS